MIFVLYRQLDLNHHLVVVVVVRLLFVVVYVRWIQIVDIIMILFCGAFFGGICGGDK